MKTRVYKKGKYWYLEREKDNDEGKYERRNIIVDITLSLYKWNKRTKQNYGEYKFYTLKSKIGKESHIERKRGDWVYIILGKKWQKMRN